MAFGFFGLGYSRLRFAPVFFVRLAELTKKN
jgi:hypothetical protein